MKSGASRSPVRPVGLGHRRVLLVDALLARVAHAYGRREVLVGQRVELVGALVAEDEAAVAAVVLAESVGELVVAVLAVRHVVVGHPVGPLALGLLDLVPAGHALVAERVARVRVLVKGRILFLKVRRGLALGGALERSSAVGAWHTYSLIVARELVLNVLPLDIGGQAAQKRFVFVELLFERFDFLL